MRVSVLRFLSTVAIALIAIVLFSILVDTASSTFSETGRVDAASRSRARRLISVPFGIADVQQLNDAGHQLTITVYAFCWEESQIFDLHVRVAQSSTNAFAEGHTINVCAGGERQTWDAMSAVGDATPFLAGPAVACGDAVEYGQHGVADEHQWCKNVELK